MDTTPPPAGEPTGRLDQSVRSRATAAHHHFREWQMIRWHQPAMNRAGRLLVVTST